MRVAVGRMRERLPRQARLSGEEAFGSVLRRGRSWKGRYLTARWVKTEGSFSRLGLIAGKRVAKRAVDRNRFRRTVREGFRRQAIGVGGCDVVIRLTKLPGSGDWGDLGAEVARALECVR